MFVVRVESVPKIYLVFSVTVCIFFPIYVIVCVQQICSSLDDQKDLFVFHHIIIIKSCEPLYTYFFRCVVPLFSVSYFI